MLAKAYGLDELALLSFSTGPVSRFNSGQTEHRVKGVQAEQAVGSGAIRGAHAIWTQLSCLNPAPSTRAALPSLAEESQIWSERRSWIHLKSLRLSSDGFPALSALLNNLTMCVSSHLHFYNALL